MLGSFALLSIFVAAPVVFILLFFFTAPYGRHTREGWGPTFSSRVGWLLMESPAVFVIVIVVFSSGRAVSPLVLFFLLLWETHYLYRTYLFPFMLRENGRGMPVVLAFMAFVFNSLNGYANGSFLAGAPDIAGTGPVPAIRIGAGVALFVVGFLTHVLADRDLRQLRKPGELGYKVPQGGLFDLIASPNYFGEIVEWTGWALATWSLPGLAFALFTMANLVPRARAHRKWYRETFPDYPLERKRVIPFVY
jgi:3-oxo-5-alpha-steroid 4-dehydrogenase 1